jgi:hypothetical protein
LLFIFYSYIYITNQSGGTIIFLKKKIKIFRNDIEKISYRSNAMKLFHLIISVIWVLSIAIDTFAMIPEPDNLIYGTVQINGIPIKALNTIIEITASVNDKTIATYKIGSNPEANNYYDLSLPLEYRNPNLFEDSVRTGETGFIYIAGFKAHAFTVGERGEIMNINLSITNAPDTDNDLIPDLLEDKNNDGNFANDDTDGDGMPDFMDSDDDRDNRPTKFEDYNNNGDPTDDDINNNGIPDYLDEDFPMDYIIPHITCLNKPPLISISRQATFSICENNITHYKFKTNESTEYSNEYSVDMPLNITVTTDGIYTIDIIGKDANDVWQTVYESTTYTWTIDTIAPVVSGLSDHYTPTQKLTWEWSANENCTYRHLISQEQQWNPTESDTFNDIQTISKDSGNGTWYLHVQAEDLAGNLSEIKTVFVILDNNDMNGDGFVNLKDAIIGIQLIKENETQEQITLSKLIRILKMLSETK